MQPAGPFEILEIPATGAYGHVAVVRHNGREGRVVAVKALRSSHLGRPRLMARARDEARLLYHLRHPNIIRVEELIDVGGRPVLVMEWVEGISVEELLDAHGPLPLPVALEIARLTAMALHAAYHTANPDGSPMRIVHRDIKPANLLLSLGGELKVVDFGVAHGYFFDRESTTINTVMGTQGYMAPERMEGLQDHPAIDVYSLGVCLGQFLSSTNEVLPLRPRPHTERLAAWCQDVAALPSGPPELMAEVGKLLSRMCTWSHDKRPDLNEVQVALSALVHACEPGPDLASFALQHAVPIYNGRARLAPREHRSWEELSFLERPWDTLEISHSASSDAIPTSYVGADPAADRRLRRLLAVRRWPERPKELTWLLARHPEWTAEPFLEVLERRHRPWWKLWQRRSTREEVVKSLQMLRYRRNESVLDRARSLCADPDEAIADAALRLLRNVE